MENAEEILQCLDEFSKLRPKEIPPELEYYLSFVARTGDPVYQWPLIKCLFREKLINVITEFYEACPSIEIPPCPNVEIFNYDAMKCFILEKLDTFAAAPFTVQRICELLTSPRKEYNRIDKYMRALEKNILVVSTREPGSRKSTENGESVVNGLESEHGSQEMVNSMNSDINVEVDMDEKTVWQKTYAVNESNIILESHTSESIQESYVSDSKATESVITTRQINYIGYTNEMLVEPSTTLSNNEDTTPQIAEPSELPIVFNLSRQTEKEEHIYVKDETSYIKADCSDMETSQIISATETEPITPPEPEEPQQSEIQDHEQPQSSIVEAESSSQSIIKSGKLSELSSNETAISSSDEMPQSSSAHLEQTLSEPETSEISGSDHQEVTESNIVIGPEDMQVEDISPEPERTDNSPVVCETIDQPEQSDSVERSVTPENIRIPENVDITTTVENMQESENISEVGTSEDIRVDIPREATKEISSRSHILQKEIPLSGNLQDDVPISDNLQDASLSDNRQDVPHKDNILKEALSKEDLSKEALSKEDLSKEDLSKEDLSKEAISIETFSKEDISKAAISKDISKEDISKEAISKQDISMEVISNEDISLEDIPKEDILKEDIPKDAISKDDISKEHDIPQEISSQEENVQVENIQDTKITESN